MQQIPSIRIPACVAALCLGSLAHASVITTNPTAPAVAGDYVTPGVPFANYNAPGLAVAVSNFLLHPTGLPTVTTVPPNEFDLSSSSVTSATSVNGSPAQATSATGPVQVELFGKAGQTTGTFQTEMLQLDLSGVSPFGPFMIRESPTLQSLGSTSVTDIGGGNFRIDSFFDVFTELSIDGGATWIPSTGPAHLNIVPEPGTGLLAACGFGALLGSRRRHS